MLTSRRDYILRIIDEVGLLLRQTLQRRSSGHPAEALQSVVAACERLFQLEATQLFQFTPDEHIAMLSDGEAPDIARDKIFLYAALSEEAGRSYRALGNVALAQQSFLNALRLALRAQAMCPGLGLPAFAPDPAALLQLLGAAPLDADTTALLAAAGLGDQPSPKSSP